MELSPEGKETTKAYDEQRASPESDVSAKNGEQSEENNFETNQRTPSDIKVASSGQITDDPNAAIEIEGVHSRNEDYLTIDDVDNNDDNASARLGDNLGPERSGSRRSRSDNPPDPVATSPGPPLDPVPSPQFEGESQAAGADEDKADFLNLRGPSRQSDTSPLKSATPRNDFISETGNSGPENEAQVDKTPENEDGVTGDPLGDPDADQDGEVIDRKDSDILETDRKGEEEEENGFHNEKEKEEEVAEQKSPMEDDNLGTFTLDQQPPDTARRPEVDEEEDAYDNDPEKGIAEQEREEEKNSGYIASREVTEGTNKANDNNNDDDYHHHHQNDSNDQSDTSKEATQGSDLSPKPIPPIKKSGAGVNKKDNPHRKSRNFATKPAVNGKAHRASQAKVPPRSKTEPYQSAVEEVPSEATAMDSDTEAELFLQGATRPRRKEQRQAYKSKEVKEKYGGFDNGSHLPRTISDDDLNSSESDVMATARDEDRYEESKLRALSVNRRNDLVDDLNDPTMLKKGRRVYFFRNGDVHFKPRQVLINSRIYQNFVKLLVDLGSIVETSTGVKHIFSWPDGREIKSITQFENGKYYVCSSTCRLQRVDYGNSKENPWKAGKVDRNENFLFKKDGKVQSPLRKPRVLTIISNMYRDSREKLILNTNSTMNFEEILHDISNMVNIPNPPVRALYTERKPHTQVFSYSQLIRDFADHDNFLACGEELVPLEMSPKRPLNGYSLSSDGSKKSSKRTPRYTYHSLDDGDGSPTRSSVVTAYTGQANGLVRQPRPDVKVRRRKTDSVRVEINGKTREFFPPTLIDDNEDGAKPDKKLRLEWVYGFRGRDVKQNLVVLPHSGELVYFVAAVVVIYDKRFATQKHYQGHSEEVTCLTIHPNGRFVATGQIAGKTPEAGAHVRIWDGLSLSTYAVVGLGVFKQGIACVSFSERESKVLEDSDKITGDFLMAIDDSDRHVMSVWEWQTEKLISKTATTADPIVSGCFYPFDGSLLITYGKEHIHFWRMFGGKGQKVLRDKLSGNFEDDVPKFVTSTCFSPTGDVITGDSNGTILIWTPDKNQVFSVSDDISIQTKRAHKKSVAALCMLGDGTLFSGGGSEIKAWDSFRNYSLVKERVLPESAGHVRSIVPMSVGGLDGSIYVTTTRNKVLEGSLQLKFKFVIQSHVEELWALESHPLEQTFVSAGHDQTVMKWSATSHAPVWKVDVEKPCISISIDPRGRLIALGTTGGKVIILNSYNGIQLTGLPTGTAQINALSFSPDGRQLAVGTFDGNILIFFVQEEGHRFFKEQTATLKHNNVFIMHLDWSLDAKYIRAVMGDYDVINWDVPNRQRVKASRSLRDVNWASLNCPLDHSIIGPWQNLERGDVINVVNRSQYRDYVVTGDSKGRVRLYKWPCSLAKAGYRSAKVYSSNVTCATFACDDSYIITSGGNDAAMMQFAILDPNNTR